MTMFYVMPDERRAGTDVLGNTIASFKRGEVKVFSVVAEYCDGAVEIKSYTKPLPGLPGPTIKLDHEFGIGDLRSYGMIVQWSDGLDETYWYVDGANALDTILQNANRLAGPATSVEELKSRIVASQRGIPAAATLSSEQREAHRQRPML